MRNPDRIAGFLSCILPFEGRKLTNEIIHEVIVNLITKKLYATQKYELTKENYKKIYYDEDSSFTRNQVEDIILNSPQEHKEAGFDKGWPSRFDTWYKLQKEFGFLTYDINENISITVTGHMLIDAYNENPVNEKKIQNVMLNALIKYPTNNPFKKNLNSNVPLVLLLQVLNLLKQDKNENGAGVFRQEIPLFVCWPDSDAKKLYNTIKQIRLKVGFNYSDEFIYDICLELLDADYTKANRFKMSKICSEAVDEYIRKMRSTGVISLRGNGRFIDFNMIEKEKISYVLENYPSSKVYNSVSAYCEYMSSIDSHILEIAQDTSIDIADVRKHTLYKYAKEYSSEKVFDELNKVCKKQPSKDLMLKFINAPTRLEFLTSLALVQQLAGLDVNPNYSVDDEGLPTFTAGGGVADIECYDCDYDSFFEVTLMCGRHDQVNNEIVPIRRHLIEHKKNKEKSFSVFLAPVIHDDTKEAAKLYKHFDKIDIIPLDVGEFISRISSISKASQLLTYYYDFPNANFGNLLVAEKK